MALLKSEQETLKPGDKAPDFKLKNIDGNMISRRQFEGKRLVVIFMCNHCPYVKPKMQEIADIQEEYKGKGVVVVGMNSNDTENYPEDNFENMQKFAEKFGYDYYLLDESQDVARAYGAECTPDPYVFDQNHELVYHGRINDAMSPGDAPEKHDLREVLDAMLEEKDIEDWFRPSMGCSIKWKE